MLFVSFALFLLQMKNGEREGGSMEYERIDKVQLQTGVISPSKLRLKLLGVRNLRKESSNNSSRTSPSKLEDLEYSKSSLLADRLEELESEGGSKKLSGTSLVSNYIKGSQDPAHPKETESKVAGHASHIDIKSNTKGAGHQVHFNTNLSSVHPVRSLEEEYFDYDSGHDNASSSSFEFHKGERILHNSMFGPFSRPIPSKWNDAEKWIPTRQTVQPNLGKKTIVQSQMNRQAMATWMRVSPEVVVPEQRANHMAVTDTKQPDTFHPASQSGLEKLIAVGSFPDLVAERGSPDQGLDVVGSLNLVNDQETNQDDATATTPAVKSVSMRDTGTEMTPMTSQEPSRTGTPVGSISPLRSPTSSIPSTPKTAEPKPSPAMFTTEASTEENKNYELSDKELQIKTRKEIVALGLQLGKMNIAAWASKEQNQNNVKASPEGRDPEQLEKLEYEHRAAAWEEAEKSKHTARYRREEIKIQAWESHQKAKIEAEIRRLEALVQQRKAQAQERMMNKLASLQQRSEEKRAMAETKRNQQEAKAAQQAEYIRQTGRIPTANIVCCSCFR
ncbi:hypothetical protein H6P81_019553 [Aristolochia fimbriata]|uniref:Remorin C-terminal domain-containing protein n=1 Tax=Aristolochia fimbriata TaxID=158543 RepID=A0AAV7DS56_ARIFI|nr:hypothetical protein H6P81_019553 [Aristolochia fimbriata]